MMTALLRLMRLGDSLMKNIFVLPALIFASPKLVFGVPQSERWAVAAPLVNATLLAFAAFCLLASGFYAINDVLDAKEDRLHPVKRLRPVASGQVSPGTAVAFGAILIAAGLGMGFLVNRNLGIVLSLYSLVQAAYNIRLKRVIFVDVVAVALGFAFRATAGAVAINVQISVWLLLCVFFLCLYLGFIKRLCDLTSAEAHGKGSWRSPAGYDDRGELNWVLGVSGTMALMTYLMYSLSDHARAIFGTRSIGFALLSPLVVIVIHRFFRRASAGISDSPLEALLHDHSVLASVALFGAGVVVTLYVPGVQELLDRLFMKS